MHSACTQHALSMHSAYSTLSACASCGSPSHHVCRALTACTAVCSAAAAAQVLERAAQLVEGACPTLSRSAAAV
eukprot:357020-Chlamydomonas_euryale.AAC.1